MRPHRIRMCHGLVMNYGLYKKMEIYVITRFTMCLIYTLSSFFMKNVESETREQVGNDPISYGRLYRFLIARYAREYGTISKRTSQV
jgi:hypothetical protein